MATTVTRTGRLAAGWGWKVSVDAGAFVICDLSDAPEAHRNPGAGGLGPGAPMTWHLDAGGTAGTATLTASLYGATPGETRVLGQPEPLPAAFTVADATGFSTGEFIRIGELWSTVLSISGSRIDIGGVLPAAPAMGARVRRGPASATFAHAVGSATAGGVASGTVNFPVAGLLLTAATATASFCSTVNLDWRRVY